MTETFRLNYNNVRIYGGFVGTDTVRDQPDWQANNTVLSGDIDVNDTTNSDGVVTDVAQTPLNRRILPHYRQI